MSRETRDKNSSDRGKLAACAVIPSGVYSLLVTNRQEVQGTADEAAIRKQFGDGMFHPGESRNELRPVQRDLKDFQAVVDVVAYADRSSDATNSDGLQRLEQPHCLIASEAEGVTTEK